eukprot:jgi/Tetstr1/427233/TSEL_017420.t1
MTDDTARSLAEKRSHAAYNEYLHLGCYAFFISCANEAMRGDLESLSTESATAESKTVALAELRASYRTHLATEEATRSRLGYLQLAKKGLTATKADRVFADSSHAKLCTPRRIAVSGQLTNSAERSTTIPSRSAFSAAGKALAAAAFAKATSDKPTPTESAERRQQREQAAAARKAAKTAAAPDKGQAQLDFMATELPRFEVFGARERGRCDKSVSRMFLVPKPGTSKCRLITDLRELNKLCKTLKMSYETLMHLRHLPRADDWFVSMALADGYYALGIREEDRDFFTGWGGRIKMTSQLRRDLEWWTHVHAQHNGRSMYKLVEAAYLHADSTSHGWGAILNNNIAYQARGFWYEDDRTHHITWKSFARLWHLLDIHDISIMPRYIQSAANVWADRLNTEPDDADWQLNPQIFAYM